MFKACTFARVRRLVNLNATAVNFAVCTIKALVLRRGVTLVLPHTLYVLLLWPTAV